MALKNLLGGAKKAEIPPKELEEIQKDFEVGDFTSADCEGCTDCYPSSLKIEDGPLFGTAPKAHGQVLVFTGQTNWKHDIGDEETPWGRVCKALSNESQKFADIVGGPVRINGVDLDPEEDIGEEKVTLIILPHFVRLVTDEQKCVEDVAYIMSLDPSKPLPKNASTLNDRGYLLLCSHRTRDKRCGITAPIMRRALEIELRHEGLYRDLDDDEEGGVRVVFCNHVGGHKFAANMLIYQKNGMALMLARLRPEHSKALVKKTILQNVVPLSHVRFCNKLESYDW